MGIKKSLVVAVAAATIGITGLTGLGIASAATNPEASENSASSIVDRLVEKFNLNKKDVEAVFEEERAERKAERQQRMEERLTEAVSQGKLTEEQKAKIIAKFAELTAEREADRDIIKDMSADERREHMEEKHKALQKWVDENNIPKEYLPFMGKGISHEPGARGDMILEKKVENRQF